MSNKTYNGKVVHTRDTFDYSTAKPGDYVDEGVVDDAINCLPPACMNSECVQMGEPYSHEQDPRTEQWRATYATFKRVTSGPDAVWQYRGHCFQGETEQLSNPPVCC